MAASQFDKVGGKAKVTTALPEIHDSLMETLGAIDAEMKAGQTLKIIDALDDADGPGDPDLLKAVGELKDISFQPTADKVGFNPDAPLEEEEPKVKKMIDGFTIQASKSQVGENPFWVDVQLVGVDQYLISGNSNGVMTRDEIKSLRKQLKQIMNMEKSTYPENFPEDEDDTDGKKKKNKKKQIQEFVIGQPDMPTGPDVAPMPVMPTGVEVVDDPFFDEYDAEQDGNFEFTYEQTDPQTYTAPVPAYVGTTGKTANDPGYGMLKVTTDSAAPAGMAFLMAPPKITAPIQEPVDGENTK